jgi:hypothetical protein
VASTVRGEGGVNFDEFNLKPKLAYILLQNSVRTAKKTQHFAITKINLLMLFKEIIPK